MRPSIVLLLVWLFPLSLAAQTGDVDDPAAEGALLLDVPESPILAHFARIQTQITRVFSAPPSLEGNELSELQGRVHVYVRRDGLIDRFDWIEHSGNGMFDLAVERALETFMLGDQRLDVPVDSEDIMRRLEVEGFEIVFDGG